MLLEDVQVKVMNVKRVAIEKIKHFVQKKPLILMVLEKKL